MQTPGIGSEGGNHLVRVRLGVGVGVRVKVRVRVRVRGSGQGQGRVRVRARPANTSTSYFHLLLTASYSLLPTRCFLPPPTHYLLLPTAHLLHRGPQRIDAQGEAGGPLVGLGPRACSETKLAQPSAQLALRRPLSAAAHAPGCPPSSGQPRPISSLGRAGRPHQPWSRHGPTPSASCSGSTVAASSCSSQSGMEQRTPSACSGGEELGQEQARVRC